MKIAIDTNIIIRIMVCDDAKLLAKAKKLIKHYSTDEILISYAVMIEAHYVLLKFYQIPLEQILEMFEDLMKIEQFNFEQEPAIRLALVKCKKGISFSDALIGEIGSRKNLKTYTFDKKLKNDSSFVVV